MHAIVLPIFWPYGKRLTNVMESGPQPFWTGCFASVSFCCTVFNVDMCLFVREKERERETLDFYCVMVFPPDCVPTKDVLMDFGKDTSMSKSDKHTPKKCE